MQRARWASALLLGAFLAVSFASPAPGAAAEPLLAIRPVPARIAVDGRLDEWRSAEASWGSFVWDSSALYAGLAVPDRQIQVDDDRTRDFSGSDRVVLLLGLSVAGPAPSGAPLGRHEFAFVLTPGSRYGRPLKTLYGFGGYEHVEADLRQVEVSVAAGPEGYTLEARIPWTILGFEAEAGKKLRVEVLAFDAQRGTAGVTTLSGQPFPGSVTAALLQPAVLLPE